MMTAVRPDLSNTVLARKLTMKTRSSSRSIALFLLPLLLASTLAACQRSGDDAGGSAGSSGTGTSSSGTSGGGGMPSGGDSGRSERSEGSERGEPQGKGSSGMEAPESAPSR